MHGFLAPPGAAAVSAQCRSGTSRAAAHGGLTAGHLWQTPTTVGDRHVIAGELHLLPLPYIV
jgi:hypothetical protein